ncbi:sialate:O-sulfotransferase 1-like [Ptychodera flava]|uniref:sialate:O-sulfotransferase 1-like n=1 Tax=Ptychodera flava TaxID=63121 RepID=UPI00396A23A4
MMGKESSLVMTSVVALAVIGSFWIACYNLGGKRELFEWIGSHGNNSGLPAMHRSFFKGFTSMIKGLVQSNSSNTTHCPIRLAPPHTFPIVALASIPGSGNSWTRHLIQQATGYATGSVYGAIRMAENGFPGEMEDWTLGTTIVVKTHTAKLPGKGLITNCTAAILLLRNPIDVAITERNRRYSKSKTGLATWYPNLRFNPAWQRAVLWQQKLYGRFVQTWCGLVKPLLVIHYEKIKENPIREVERLLKFLNVTVSEDRMACVRDNIEGNFHREYSDKDEIYRQFITENMKADALEAMEVVSEMLRRRGLDPVPWGAIPRPVLPSFYKVDYETQEVSPRHYN